MTAPTEAEKQKARDAMRNENRRIAAAYGRALSAATIIRDSLPENSPEWKSASRYIAAATSREADEMVRAAEAQLSAVTADRDALTGKSLEWKCRALAAESANAEMRAALKPFALDFPLLQDHASIAILYFHDLELSEEDTKRRARVLTVGDFRAADAVLKALGGAA